MAMIDRAVRIPGTARAEDAIEPSLADDVQPTGSLPPGMEVVK
jgi:glutamate/aspartate transport system permease protein